MKLRQESNITVNTDVNKQRTVNIHNNCKYPETKEEGIYELGSSHEVIIKELLYMIGCVYYLKAPFLQPIPKKKWFDAILKIVDDMDEIQKMLSVYPSNNPITEDDIPF